ncbi:hypothetical protein TNCV_2443531 [Trichonephila clavipes]|nr:hypothetical protein TNCV_2443531 [Trichonephila clavipes]
MVDDKFVTLTISKDANVIEKYSGEWYVIAQDEFHFIEAVKCQRVTYTPKGIGMTFSYNVTNQDAKKLKDLNGTLKVEGETKGELSFTIKSCAFKHGYVYYDAALKIGVCLKRHVVPILLPVLSLGASQHVSFLCCRDKKSCNDGRRADSL